MGNEILAQCQQLLNTLAIVSELFIPFRDDAEQLHTLLQQETLERYSTWPANPLIRKLYWHNLITQRGESFVWHSEFIRELEMDKLGE